MKKLCACLFGLMLLAAPAAPVFAADHYRDHDRDRHDWVEAPIVSFTVVRTRLVTEECERCSYRSRRGLGVFRVETRLYSEFLGGRVLRTWYDTTEYFDHCAGSRQDWRED
jgi:hypothetical protein